MIPLTFLCDEYIDWPKKPFEYIVPPPTSGVGTISPCISYAKSFICHPIDLSLLQKQCRVGLISKWIKETTTTPIDDQIILALRKKTIHDLCRKEVNTNLIKTLSEITSSTKTLHLDSGSLQKTGINQTIAVIKFPQ